MTVKSTHLPVGHKNTLNKHAVALRVDLLKSKDRKGEFKNIMQRMQLSNCIVA